MKQILQVKNIEKNFGGVKALDNCSLEIEKGNITAIIGPNGSGKTTLFDCISRLLPFNAGIIRFNGEEINKSDDFALAKKGVSRTFQEVRLFKNLTIREHLEIALNEKDEFLFESLFKKQDCDNKIKEILELVGLHKDANTYADDLSYGQKKLLNLAIAISKKHELLMLDEPVAGINPKLREEIKNILRELQKNGETIVVVEHDMNFVMDIAGYIYVLDYGKVISHGKPQTIQKDKKVLEAYLGE